MKEKITKEMLISFVEQGLTLTEMAERVGRSRQGLAYYFYKNFDTTNLERIQNMLGAEQAVLAEHEMQFENPLVHVDLASGEDFSRLEEFWDSQGVEQVG